MNALDIAFLHASLPDALKCGIEGVLVCRLINLVDEWHIVSKWKDEQQLLFRGRE